MQLNRINLHNDQLFSCTHLRVTTTTMCTVRTRDITSDYKFCIFLLQHSAYPYSFRPLTVACDCVCSIPIRFNNDASLSTRPSRPVCAQTSATILFCQSLRDVLPAHYHLVHFNGAVPSILRRDLQPAS